MDGTDTHHIAVSAISFTAINLNISSYKLYMCGHTVTSRSSFRQVLEGISLAFFCSAKDPPVPDRCIANQCSIKNAVTDLKQNADWARVNRRALQTVIDQHHSYH